MKSGSKFSKNLDFNNIPVIKWPGKTIEQEELLCTGLECLDIYGIYKVWERLTPGQKKRQRSLFQEALKPHSLVYINKTSPHSISSDIRKQFTTKDYDWEETDFVKTLEKMYFVYEPKYWSSFQTYDFKYVGKGALRPLFMGFIDWDEAKSPKTMNSYFEQIEYFLEDTDVPEEDSIRVVDYLKNLIAEKGAYTNPKTGKSEPKISLWVFFTQDQNPKKYTGGRFRALAKDKDEYSVSAKVSSDEGFESSENSESSEDEDVRVIMDGPSPESEDNELELEKALIASIRPGESAESISEMRWKARMRLFNKPKENTFYLGNSWGFSNIILPKRTKTKLGKTKLPEPKIVEVRKGRIPKLTRKKKETMSVDKAILINIREIYDRNYLLPPLRRGVTVLSSQQDFYDAIEELKNRIRD